MGVVYRAEQDSPRRTVALKLIRHGLAGPAVVQRFAAEVEILGRLQHPGIAQIFEAGMADLGDGPQPYFAMEFVEGRTLAEVLADPAVSLRQRLELFIRICDAVQHAHQKGVIHRDLKPANVLVACDEQGTEARSHGGAKGDASVTPAGGEKRSLQAASHSARAPDSSLRASVPPCFRAFPKILDFGVARATDGDLAVQTVHTTVGQLVGTLPYMSPEQIGGDPRDLDTRSDVYALGVILYEMLAGHGPYDLAHRSLPEVARIIREEEPYPLNRANRAVPADLQWIIRKALEKDRARRYAGAGDLAADVRRFLSDEPIIARRPTVWYQLTKFSRRNRALVASAATLALATVVGLVAVSAALSRALVAENQANERRAEAEAARKAEFEQRELADRESRRARDEADTAEAVSKFLDDMLASVNPSGGDREVTVREVLDRAANDMASAYPDRPLVEARLRTTIGRSYRGLGRFTEAGEQFRAALAIRARELGESGEMLESLNDVAINFQDQSRLDEAEATLRRALHTAERRLGPEEKNTLDVVNNLGLLLVVRGRYEEAEKHLRRALDGNRRISGDQSRLTLDAMTNLATLLQYTGRYGEAELLAREGLATRRRVFDPRDPGTLIALNNLGTLLAAQGKLSEAEPLYFESLELSRAVLGEDHPDTLTGMANVAGLLRDLDRGGQAEPMHRAALAARRRVLGDAHADTIDSMRNLALTLCDPPPGEADAADARLREAIELLREAVKNARAALGAEAPDTLACLHVLGGALRKSGDLDGALAAAGEAFAGARKTFGDDAIKTALYRSGVGDVLTQRGAFAEAEVHLLGAHETLVQTLGATHAQVQQVEAALARLYQAWGKPDQAARRRK
jgi:serine/threonine protein kinase